MVKNYMNHYYQEKKKLKQSRIKSITGYQWTAEILIILNTLMKVKLLIKEADDYTSHNTHRLNVKEIEELLLSLDFIKESLGD